MSKGMSKGIIAMAAERGADAKKLEESITESANELEMLIDIVSNLKIDDATHRTTIIDNISAIRSSCTRWRGPTTCPRTSEPRSPRPRSASQSPAAVAPWALGRAFSFGNTAATATGDESP